MSFDVKIEHLSAALLFEINREVFVTQNLCKGGDNTALIKAYSYHRTPQVLIHFALIERKSISIATSAGVHLVTED